MRSSHTRYVRTFHCLRQLARLHPWSAVAAATALTVGLVQVVGLVSGAPDYRHLLWNLFLAWIPLPIAGAAYIAQRRGFGLPTIAPLVLAWLMFFPNAPYLVTELVHFRELGDRVPAELDLATLVATAIAGLLVGFASLYVVQRVIGHRFGWRVARIAAFLALGMASLGVYMGRVLRWNSWDAITTPDGIIADLAVRAANPVAFQEAWIGIGAFAVFLSLSYLVALRLAGRDESAAAD